MDGSIIFARMHQCALTSGDIGTTRQIRLNLCFLRPTWVHNPNDKSISSAVFAQLTAESPYTLQWALLSPQNCPFRWRIWTPSILWFLGPIQTHNPNGISIGSAVFTHTTVECPYTLRWNAPSPPPKNCPFQSGGSGPPSNTWLPGPTRVLNPDGISIGWAVSAGLTSVTHRQTDRQTTLLSLFGHIYVRSTAMQLIITTTTSGQSNLTQSHIAAAHGSFSGIRQVAPVCTPPKTCFLQPSQLHNPNGISIGSTFFHSLWQSVRALYHDRHFPPENSPFSWGIWTSI